MSGYEGHKAGTMYYDPENREPVWLGHFVSPFCGWETYIWLRPSSTPPRTCPQCGDALARVVPPEELEVEE